LSSVRLCFGGRVKAWKLAQPAYGLSRFALDRIMLDGALTAGAVLIREARKTADLPLVVAAGRQCSAPAGDRLFGFKAHFQGSADDTMSLYFFDGCYVGVNCVEGGKTNVCGLAPERVLRETAFSFDTLIRRSGALCERLIGLSRSMEWLVTGPLVFGAVKHDECRATYPAGDALGFVDPFTGSGMLAAIMTGLIAGRAAANGRPTSQYLSTCRTLLDPQYRVAALCRFAVRTGVAQALMPLVPGKVIFHLTRPGKLKSR
jgi:hypothetical protein